MPRKELKTFLKNWIHTDRSTDRLRNRQKECTHSSFPLLAHSGSQRRKVLSAWLMGETLSQQDYTDSTWHIDINLPDSPQGHLVNQRARKYIQKKDLRELGKWNAVHWSYWHLTEGTAGDINNHFSHQTAKNEHREGKKKQVFCCLLFELISSDNCWFGFVIRSSICLALLVN